MLVSELVNLVILLRILTVWLNPELMLFTLGVWFRPLVMYTPSIFKLVGLFYDILTCLYNYVLGGVFVWRFACNYELEFIWIKILKN